MYPFLNESSRKIFAEGRGSSIWLGITNPGDSARVEILPVITRNFKDDTQAHELAYTLLSKLVDFVEDPSNYMPK